MRFILCCLLAACTSSGDPIDTSMDTDTEVPAEPVAASIQLLGVQGGALPEGIVVTSTLESITLDASSAGTLQVPADAQFYLSVEADTFITHHLTGMAGQEDFRLVSFFASQNIGSVMYNLLNLEQDPEKGILIVALDNPDLSPAVGAAAEIDASHDGAFVSTGFGVAFSNVVNTGGFVAFPNVPPGDTTITITPPDGKTCTFHPAGGADATVTLFADEATVAFFVCD